MLAGAMFGLAGAILQTIMRNPLAEPEMTGATSGAVLFAVLWLSQDPRQLAQPGLFLPFVALLGGLVGGGLVYLLSWQGQNVPDRLVLTGVIISAVLRSGTSIILLLRQEALGSILLWLIGSLNGRGWTQWNVIWPWALVALPLGLAGASLANVLQLGEASATSLGLRVAWTRLSLFFVAVLLTASAVAVVGGIAFLGLIAPHIARRIVGSDARRLFLFSTVLGAEILLAADAVTQAISQPATIPVGASLALLGVPYLLYLVWRRSP
jgi:iron complex transport system permease protein